MHFKFTKTDAYLFLLYFGFAIPSMLLSVFYNSDIIPPISWMIGFTVEFVIRITLSVYVLIYVLLPRLFINRNMFWGLLSIMVFLILGGIVLRIDNCWLFKSDCATFGYEYVLNGFLSQIRDLGVLAIIMMGKKLFEAQLDFLKIEKEKKENELRLLQSQIDPHFLFNNLNTVDAIIDKDPKMAKNYLNKLAQLYRYLITSKDDDVVSLKDELAFAKNYIYLIENRFGNAFQFNIKENISAEADILIPPGALQTLLENVVKHNQASSENPIKTTIIINEKNISIRNNIIKKHEKVDSTDTGLNNLMKRYKLLTNKEVHIHENDYFTVELPIIKEVN